MIYINGSPADMARIARARPVRGIESICLSRMMRGAGAYYYASIGELHFELALRRTTVARAERLRLAGLNFESFRGSYCNKRYWIRTANGGFELRRGVSPAAAVRDIYSNGREYGTECATAMQIVYCGALLDLVADSAFDAHFGGMRLMNWHDIPTPLKETGSLHRVKDYLPGDRRYFSNPEVNLNAPEWQGENVIDMGDGTYYGHGIGRRRADKIIATLNSARRASARRSAYLIPTAGRPDYSRLYSMFGSALRPAPR